MALTLVSRETFQGVGTLNTASPGNLGTVHASANFYKRPVGPKVSGDTTALGKGWSADMRINGTGLGMHTIALTGGAVTAGMSSAWYYIDTAFTNGSNKCDLMEQRLANTNQLLLIGLNPLTGKFTQNRNGLWVTTDTVDYPIRTWFELRCQWTTSGSNCTSVSADYRVAGSSTWNSIYTFTGGSFSMGGPIVEMRSGVLNGGARPGIRGRYGMPSLYTMGSWADRLDSITDVVDPVAGATSWYVNAATGSDTNDGLTSGTAWASVTKINDESFYCGMFPTAAGYANGDTLTIDTTSANLVLGSSNITISTRGLNIVQLGGGLTGTGEIQAWKTISSGSWSAVGGAANVYMSNDTDLSAVLWEDDKWLTHVTGTNIAAATAALVSTAGSFWTEGTNMYVHPFGNTNPASDGKVYTRSYSRSGGTTSAVLLNVPDLRLSGLRVRKTCVAHKDTHDAGANYCYQGNSAFGGTSFFENCYGDYGSKHIFGFTDNDTARQVILNNCQAEQGSPYSSQTPWVDYSSFSTAGTATTTYNNCTTNSGTGLVGSTTGVLTGTAGWVCHNNGGGNYQFAQITFNNCNINGLFETYGAVNTFRYNGGSFGGGTFRSPDTLISQARVVGRMIGTDSALGGVTRVRNCILIPTSANAGSAIPCQGTVDYQGNIVDLRSTTSNTTLISFFSRFAALTFIWKNNFFIGHATIDFTLLQNGVSTDTYTFNNNAYLLGPANKVVDAYNDGSTTANRTFAQWQALGKDANSFTTTFAAAVASDYKPIKNSPLINAGIDLGPLVDYTGISFLVRNDIGAYEYVPIPGSGLLSSGFRF